MKNIKLILYFVIAFMLLFNSSCCDFQSIFWFLYSGPENEKLDDCSSIEKLKLSLYKFDKCYYQHYEEFNITIDSISWRINETDSTFEVYSKIKDKIFQRKGLEQLGYRGKYIIIRKKDCKILHYWPQ